MTTTLDTNELITPTLAAAVKPPQESRSKRKAATDVAASVARARTAIEKLEEQNGKAADILQTLSALWLSAEAKRRRGEAEIALNHFNEALTALRKALAAT